MKHRHLNKSDFSGAAIDDIIENGSLEDWFPLAREIKKEPFGEIAERTEKICKAHHVYGGSAFFLNLIDRCRHPAAPKYKKIEGELDSKPNSWF